MSYEEFLAWADEDTSAEWVDGEVVFMSPVNLRHQDVVGFLLRLMSQYVEMKKLGKVFYERFQMKTGPDLPGREPDIIFVANEHVDRIQFTRLEGPGDLVVEVVSPDDPKRDYIRKYDEYQRGGVREYWLIDPQKRDVKFYVLGEDGKFRQASPNVEGVYRAKVLDGFWIKVDWLWLDNHPPLLSVLKLWGLLD
jgi:Uma2 family endonuclease